MVVNRKFGREESGNLDALLSALKTELEARERCTVMKTGGSNVDTPIRPGLNSTEQETNSPILPLPVIQAARNLLNIVFLREESQIHDH